MLLFHGTKATLRGKIERDGIQPRGSRMSNWGGSLASHPKLVYLTDQYPAYYARYVCASREDGLIAVVESDLLDESLLRADEDALTVKGEAQKNTRKLRRDASYYDLRWKESLARLGCCAYAGRVPPGAIVGFIEIEWQKLDSSLLMELVDVGINPMAIRLLSGQRKTMMRYLMGEKVSAAELLNKGFEDVNGFFRKRDEYWQGILDSRAGVKFHDTVKGVTI